MLVFGSGAFNVRNAGALRACCRLNEVPATTVPAGHHRLGVRLAVSGSGQASIMQVALVSLFTATSRHQPIRTSSASPRASFSSLLFIRTECAA